MRWRDGNVWWSGKYWTDWGEISLHIVIILSGILLEWLNRTVETSIWVGGRHLEPDTVRTNQKPYLSFVLVDMLQYFQPSWHRQFRINVLINYFFINIIQIRQRICKLNSKNFLGICEIKNCIIELILIKTRFVNYSFSSAKLRE